MAVYLCPKEPQWHNAIFVPEEFRTNGEWRKNPIRQGQFKCCFTSTETVGLLGTGAQDSHLNFHTPLSSEARRTLALNLIVSVFGKNSDTARRQPDCNDCRVVLSRNSVFLVGGDWSINKTSTHYFLATRYSSLRSPCWHKNTHT